MDEKFETWQRENQEFCKKADVYEQQILYITEGVIYSLDRFREYQLNLDENYRKIDINRLVNKLGKIRTIISNTRKEKS